VKTIAVSSAIVLRKNWAANSGMTQAEFDGRISPDLTIIDDPTLNTVYTTAALLIPTTGNIYLKSISSLSETARCPLSG